MWLVWLITLGLFAAGATGIGLAIARGDGSIGLAGVGVIALAAIYLISAIRRRPL